MKDYQRFFETVFPGDEPVVLNPIEQDADVADLIAEVSQQTGVDHSYLENATAAVVHGFAGARCLWFLHGAQGEVRTTQDPGGPEWYQSAHGSFREFVRMKVRLDPSEKRRGIETVNFVPMDDGWKQGKIKVIKDYENGKSVEQVLKVGKLINAYLSFWRGKRKNNLIGVENLRIREAQGKAWGLDLDKRATKAGWEWYVSAHPFDVLTMSFNRSWTSGMRPPAESGAYGGDAKFGPLTDMAAGSAVLFIRAIGADQPCGRIILRPAIGYLDRPTVLYGGKHYGCGPDDFDDVDFVESLLAPFLEGKGVQFDQQDLEWLTDRGLAMGRGIYDDVGKGFVEQSEELYVEAYRALQKANWPKPQLDVGAMGTVAQNYIDDYEVANYLLGERRDAEEILESEGFLDYIRDSSLADLLGMAKEGFRDGNWTEVALDESDQVTLRDASGIGAEDYDALEDFIDEAEMTIQDTVIGAVENNLVGNKTYLIALPFDPETTSEAGEWNTIIADVWSGDAARDPDKITRDIRNADTPVMNVDVREVMAKGNPPLTDWSEVEVFAAIPEDIHDNNSYVFEDRAVGYVELPPGYWNWDDWLEEYVEE